MTLWERALNVELWFVTDASMTDAQIRERFKCCWGVTIEPMQADVDGRMMDGRMVRVVM